MKKFFLSLIFCLMCLQPFFSDAPFKLTPVADGILLGTGAAFSASALIVKKTVSLPEYTERTYDFDSINFIDRKLSHTYNKTLDYLGTATCAVNLALPAVMYGAGFFGGMLSASDIATLAAMYAEAYLFNYGAKTFLKLGIHRVRPYMYYDGYPENALDNYDFEFSSPSGHTTDSFLGAGFLSYTFCRYFPESKWKIPVIAASYSVAVGTAALRILSGNHFLTDTIFGAALGTVCGIGIPLLHELIASRSGKAEQTALRKGDIKYAVTPLFAYVRFAL